MKRSEPAVLLVNPWIFDFAAYDSWSKPVGLLSVGGALVENGYHVSLLDCLDRAGTGASDSAGGKPGPHGTGHYSKAFLPKPAPYRSIPRRYGRYGMSDAAVDAFFRRSPAPDLIFVTSGMTYWYPAVVDMVRRLKAAYPKTPVVLGGTYATLCRTHAERVSGADAVVSGEGEGQAVGIADSMTGHRSEKTDYSNLDDVPFLPYHLYLRLESAAVLTSRGCSYRCPFCASHLLTGMHRKRDPERVVEEIEILVRGRRVRHIAFYDDALLHDTNAHFLPILEGIIQRGLGVFLHTPNGLHPRWVDSRLAALLKKAGGTTVRLSYESANPDRQRAMGLKVTDDDFTAAVECLRTAGFQQDDLGGYVIQGLPDQSIGEALESMLFVFRLGIKASVASFSPIPGTACWNEAVRRGLLDVEADPLLSNNFYFPMTRGPGFYQATVALGSLSALGNRIIQRGGMPLGDPEFKLALSSLERGMRNAE